MTTFNNACLFLTDFLFKTLTNFQRFVLISLVCGIVLSAIAIGMSKGVVRIDNDTMLEPVVLTTETKIHYGLMAVCIVLVLATFVYLLTGG